MPGSFGLGSVAQVGPGKGNGIGVGIAFSGSYLYVAAESVGANKAPGFATIEYVQDAAVVSATSVTFPAQKSGDNQHGTKRD